MPTRSQRHKQDIQGQDSGGNRPPWAGGPGDTTAPTLTAPTGAKTGSTTANVGATTNENNGRIYGVCTTTTAVPTKDQILHGQDAAGNPAPIGSQNVSSTGSKSFGVAGLTPSTTYYAHLLHVDDAGNQSNVVSYLTGFLTDAVADTIAPVLSVPTGVKTGSTTANIGATTNENNGIMFGVCTLTTAVPSAANIMAGKDAAGNPTPNASLAISSTGAKTFAVGGLTLGTTYYSHVVHMDNATNISNVVSYLTGFTTDADVVAPILSVPTGVKTGTATATIGATTNDNTGNLYGVITKSTTPPSKTQIINGQDGAGLTTPHNVLSISSSGIKTMSITGAEEGTVYYAHLVHVDAALNQSNIVSYTTGFTTDVTAPANVVWVVGYTDTTPDFTMDIPNALIGDHVVSELSPTGANTWSAYFDYTLVSAPGGTVTVYSVTDLPDGDRDFRFKVVHGSVPSAWTTVTHVITNTAPLISSLLPADGETAASITANLVATYNKAIAFGTGTINLYQTGGTLIESFDVVTEQGTGPGQVSISGAVLTINPTASLAQTTGYYVQIDASAIKNLNNVAFAGIADNTTWNFTTQTTAGLISYTEQSGLPVGGTGAFGGYTVMDLTWKLDNGATINSLGCYVTAITGALKMKILKRESAEVYSLITEISGSHAAGGWQDFTLGTPYVVPGSGDYYVGVFASSNMIDRTGTPNLGLRAIKSIDIIGSNETLVLETTDIAPLTRATGTVVDTTAPVINTLSPADNEVNVAPNVNLVITFTEAYGPISAGSGSVRLYKLDGTLIQTFTVGTAAVVISGNTVTMDPTALLAASTDYYVLIDATAFQDRAGNFFAGISNPATWSFTSAAAATYVQVHFDGTTTYWARGAQFTGLVDGEEFTIGTRLRVAADAGFRFLVDDQQDNFQLVIRPSGDISGYMYPGPKIQFNTLATAGSRILVADGFCTLLISAKTTAGNQHFHVYLNGTQVSYNAAPTLATGNMDMTATNWKLFADASNANKFGGDMEYFTFYKNYFDLTNPAVRAIWDSPSTLLPDGSGPGAVPVFCRYGAVPLWNGGVNLGNGGNGTMAGGVT